MLIKLHIFENVHFAFSSECRIAMIYYLTHCIIRNVSYFFFRIVIDANNKKKQESQSQVRGGQWLLKIIVSEQDSAK